MMPVCSRILASDPFGVQLSDPKEDMADLFSGEECEAIFRHVDFNSIDLDNVDVSVFSSYDSEDDSDGECVNSKNKFRENRNHDCMWGGQCCNKEFQRTQVPPKPAVQHPYHTQLSSPKSQQPVLITHSSQNKVVTIQKCIQKCSGNDRTENVVVVTNKVPARTPLVKSEGRSLLLNRTTQPQPQPQNPSPVKIKREFLTPQNSRPETPQSLSGSDEEEFVPIPLDTHNTTTFRSALDAFTSSSSSSSSSSSCDWDDELYMFGRTKERCAAVPSYSDIMRNVAVAKSDHSYGVSSKNVKLEGLGVDTPSDSEEEIDVVSLSERSSSSRSSSCGGLPTRPTPRDQEHLEEITTSLLSASEAVSRKLLKKAVTAQQGTYKRKKYESESSEDDDDDDDQDQDMEQDYDDYEEIGERLSYAKYNHRQNKRQKQSPLKVRRKKSNNIKVEEDDSFKRDLHNNMERMRRIDLRNSFEELKALVPAVASKDRAAKVVILREAAQYCDELGAECQSKCLEVMTLRKEQQRLHAMVRSLRKAAAVAVKTPRRYH